MIDPRSAAVELHNDLGYSARHYQAAGTLPVDGWRDALRAAFPGAFDCDLDRVPDGWRYILYAVGLCLRHRDRKSMRMDRVYARFASLQCEMSGGNFKQWHIVPRAVEMLSERVCDCCLAPGRERGRGPDAVMCCDDCADRIEDAA
jgi:hypothetical protein